MLSASMAPNLLLGQAKGANERVRVGVMGLGRGRGHISALMDVPNAELAYVCDVDKVRLAAGAKAVVDKGGKEPKAVEDFRRMLDDGDLDAISIATPNFCHTPAAIAACRAGKHVYVEKPGSYNAYEARKVVEVAKTTDRSQSGSQARFRTGGWFRKRKWAWRKLVIEGTIERSGGNSKPGGAPERGCNPENSPLVMSPGVGNLSGHVFPPLRQT